MPNLFANLNGSFIIFNENIYENVPASDDLDNLQIGLAAAYGLSIGLLLVLRVAFNEKMQEIIDYKMGLPHNGGYSSTPFYTALGFTFCTALAIRNFDLYNLNNAKNATAHFTLPLAGMLLGTAVGVLHDKYISRCGPYVNRSVRSPLLASSSAISSAGSINSDPVSANSRFNISCKKCIVM
ncbi:MAG: hypothetical protein ABSF18_04040 [Gammaproteobacteria bacterium]